MKKLILLYWGCVFLMYLSQAYYPAEPQHIIRKLGERHFMLRKSDIFMIIAIIWMTCFSFLRTQYNDTGNYIGGFLSAKSPVLFILEGKLLNFTGNPLYLFYECLARSITDNYHIFFLLPAYLSSIAIIKLFKCYSVNLSFIHLIFFSIGT